MLNKLIVTSIAILGGLLIGCGGRPPVVTEGPVQTTSAICTFPIGSITAGGGGEAVLWPGWLKGSEETVIFAKTNDQGQREVMFAYNIIEKNKFDIKPEKIIFEMEHKKSNLYNSKFEGKKIDLSYTRLVGWPFPTEFKKIQLEGITGKMVITKFDGGGREIPLAQIPVVKTYIPAFMENRLYRSPGGKYLILISKADRAHPIAYVFNLEGQ